MPNVKIMFVCPVTLISTELNSGQICLFPSAIKTTLIRLLVLPVIEMATM
jgi:hypothetical protein